MNAGAISRAEPMNQLSVAPACLVAENLFKQYGAITAVQGLSFELTPGEALALCGENGAGKSSVFRMLAGEAAIDGGSVRFLGRDFRPGSAAEAVAAGLSMVHQEFNVLPSVSVAENMFIGRLAQFQRFGCIHWPAVHAKAAALLQRLGIAVDPRAEMGTLSPSKQKMVELARAISSTPRVLLLDEITAALDHDDCETLHRIMEELRAQGTAILYVSHRLQEIFRCCQRVIVMKDGAHVTTRPTAELDEDTLSALMVGRNLEQRQNAHQVAAAAPVVLRLTKVSAAGFTDLSLEVRQGEIVSLAGLAGSGADEALDAVFGVRPISGGTMEIEGQPLRPGGVHEAMASGIAMVPKERAVEGLIDVHSIRANIGLANLDSLSRGGIVSEALERQAAASGIEMFRIKCNSQASPVRSLSGGNKQKVLLAKWFQTNPRLMLLNNPTRGVDVGVKFEIYELLDKLRQSRNLAILMASEDMSEIVRISDTVVTLRHGRVSGVFRGADEITETNLINAML